MTKRKLLLRIAATIGVIILLLAIMLVAVLHSHRFHRYVLSRLVDQASQSSGARVEIGDFNFHWSGLKVDFYRVVMHGTEPAWRPPLLAADHILVGLKIISLWRRKIDVNEIVIDHPSLHLWVDQQQHSNLPPASPPAPGSKPVNPFDLAIGHFVINQGEVDYNDRHIPLQGEFRDLHAEVSFNSFKTEYAGTLGYRDGRIQMPGYNPLRHTVEARFGVTPSGLSIDSLQLDAGSSTLSLQAQVRNFADPSLDGAYHGVISTGELAKFMKATSFPVGMVGLEGKVHYASRPHQPPLNCLLISGQLQSPFLAVNTPQAHTSIHALAGDYRLADGSLDARIAQAEILGGRLSGNLTMTHLSDQPVAHAAAVVRDVSIEAVSAAVGEGTTQLKRGAISGRLNGTMKASWQGSGNDLQLLSDATITAAAPVRRVSPSGAGMIPLQGALHLAYDGPTGVITLNHTQFTTPHTSLTLDGSTGKQSSLNIQAHSDDLREVDQIVLIARSATGGSGRRGVNAVEPLGISGSGSFAGQLRGSMNDPYLTGQISSTSFQYQGASLNQLRANVALSPSNASLSQGVLQTSDRGQVQFNVSAALRNWSYTPQSQVRVDLTAARMPVATVERLASLHYPVSGTLAAHVSVHGTQSNLVAQGNATLTAASVWNQPVQSLSAQFQGAGSKIQSSLQVQTPAGSGSGKLSYDFRNQGYEADFKVANLQLDKLTALNQEKLQVAGVINASLQGRGTVKDPQVNATISAPKLVVGQQTLDGLKLQADVAQHKAILTVDTAAQGASIQARANVNLYADYNATASIDMKNIQLGALLVSYLPQAPSGLHGEAELHGTLQGPLSSKNKIVAEIEIPKLNLAYQSLQIGNIAPIRADYRNFHVALQQCALKGTGTDLQIRADVPLDRTRSMQASATGDIDLHLLQLVYPEWDTAGHVHLDVNAQGAFNHPNVHGTVHVVDAVLQPSDTPLGAQKLNAELAIDNGRVDVQSFTAEAGGGTVSGQGFATFQPAVQFNLRMAAKKVRLRYPRGTREILDSTLLLTGSRDSALLSGQVAIDRLSLTKEFDLSKFADQFTGSFTAAPGPSFAQNVRLNVAVRTASDMAVASSQLSVQGSANLMVQGTAADPIILGRTDINEGEIFFNGQRYVVESGVIQFVNPLQTEPVLNLHATTTVDQFNISVNMTGPIDRLNVTYTSDPPLAPVDIINLIATGKTTEAASSSPTTPQSVIAGQLTNQFSSRVEKLAGISSLTIDPQVGGGQGTGAGRLAVQQRVTKNLFFTFTTDLTTSTGQVVQVEYQVTKRFAVSTIRDQNGGYTVQVKLHKRF